MSMNLGELYWLVRKLRSLLQDAFSSHGDDPPYFVLVLSDVLANPGTDIKAICERTPLAQSVVSKAVAMARGRRLLDVLEDPRDRRRLRVTPSKQLKALVRKARATKASNVLRPLLRGLSRAEQRLAMRGIELLGKAAARAEAKDNME